MKPARPSCGSIFPVAGAIKIEYSTTGGWRGTIFAQTGSAAGLEIGVKDDDVIEDVVVSYVEGGGFTSMPANVEAAVKHDWTHYKRITDDGSTRDWWPTNADFAFSGDATTACGVVNSEVQWDVIPGRAFEKPVESEETGGDTVPAYTVPTGWVNRWSSGYDIYF